MDALSSLFSNIGGFFTNSPAGGWSGGPAWGNIGKAAGVAGLGDQFINNWMAQRKQNDYINQQLRYQKNPQLAQNEITRMTQPLDQNLIAAVTNQVQGNLGTQGLAESPNIMASIMAQSLAPYNQQNMDQARQLWQAIHGQPPPFPQPASMTGLWRWLLGSNQAAPNQVPDTSSIPSPVPGWLDQWLQPSGDSTLGAGDLFNWNPGNAAGAPA